MPIQRDDSENKVENWLYENQQLMSQVENFSDTIFKSDHMSADYFNV